MRRNPVLALAILATAILPMAGSASAQQCLASHCDALVARDHESGESCGSPMADPQQGSEYSQLVSGARDFDVFPIATLYPIYAYSQRLAGSYSTTNPGFNSVASPCNIVPELARLPASRGVYFDFLTEPPTAGGAARNLLYWDGLDDGGNGLDVSDVEWGPVPLDEVMRLEKVGTNPLVFATADGGTDESEGLLINTTGSSGNIHTHLRWQLDRAGPGIPTRGVYMVKLDLTVAGFPEGAPTYYVFSTEGIALGAEDVARDQINNDLVFSLCDDGIDNDRDGFIDYAGGDPGCDDADDDSEKSPVYECDDGIDNDGDGFVDHRSDDFGVGDIYADRDPECDLAGPQGTSEEVPEPTMAMLLSSGTLLLAGLARRRARLNSRCA